MMAEFDRSLTLQTLLAPEPGCHSRLMAMLVIFCGMLVAASIAAVLDLTPDTHRECSQHGHFEF